MMPRPRSSGVLLALLLLALTGCGGPASDNAPPNAAEGSASTPAQAQAASPSPTAMSTPTTPRPDEATTMTTESPEPTPDTEPTPEEETAVITIRNFTYEGPRSVAPGTRIMVKNQDDVIHTVTAKNKGSFDVSVPAGTTETFTAPSEPGRYPYDCTFHANMDGTLRVG